jgi:predicted membrane-bound spermidine synthase
MHMGVSPRRAGIALLLLFTASGFAALIYQSVWTHYLGLTLGHAAYAQSLVLAIFMGGMALGAWIASRHSERMRRLLLAYAAIEALVGIAGLLFHPLFVHYMAFSADSVLPVLHGPASAHAYQWLSAALLIAPQCVLLGATFPILSAGCMRLAPGDAAPILGGLYFSNSIGAAIGALVTAFWLLPAIGMPGSVRVAGVLNLAVAIAAVGIWRWTGDAAPPPARPRVDERIPDRNFMRFILFAAAITGATSFVYELGWVRMLNQALGTTVHAFELMLAAFILGLAFGGLWVRRRGAASADASRTAGYAQVAMGVAALLSIPMFNQSFRWVGWLLAHVARDDAGYAWFNVGSGAIAMLVMFPAAFFAGMTLPLFTMAMLRRGSGEAAIGRVYAANTLGAIVGVMLMLHVLVPWIGVRLAVTLAALADIALGLYLLRFTGARVVTRGYGIAGIVALLACAVSLLLGKPDPRAQVAGVFRTGQARVDDAVTVPYLRDGKTATVSISATPSGRHATIATNGKTDAGLATRLDIEPDPDEVTMLMAGALPLALHPHPDRVAVIGWGSGLTTHTLLGSPLPHVVDSIEIERAMHDGARLFGERVARAYRDPRSHVHFEDARTYFATGNRHYDLIVSEPSNPWVSGVASLFTREFYGFIRRHLAPGGVLVQWVQAYELNDALLATMAAALLDVFPDSEVYVTNSNDLLLVAYGGPRPTADESHLDVEPLHAELRRVGLGSAEEFQLRRIGGAATLRNLVRLTGASPHSDYYPTVTLEAPKARFKRESAHFLLNEAYAGLPIAEMLGERRSPAASSAIADTLDSLPADKRQLALAIREALQRGGPGESLRRRWPGFARSTETLLALSAHRVDDTQVGRWSDALTQVSAGLHAGLAKQDVLPLFDHPRWLADATGQPQAVRALLALQASIAAPDVAILSARARDVLALPPASIAPLAREQALVAAMLAAIVAGHPRDVAGLEAGDGRTIAPSNEFGTLRSWLLAWADGAQAGSGTHR